MRCWLWWLVICLVLLITSYLYGFGGWRCWKIGDFSVYRFGSCSCGVPWTKGKNCLRFFLFWIRKGGKSRKKEGPLSRVLSFGALVFPFFELGAPWVVFFGIASKKWEPSFWQEEILPVVSVERNSSEGHKLKMTILTPSLRGPSPFLSFCIFMRTEKPQKLLLLPSSRDPTITRTGDTLHYGGGIGLEPTSNNVKLIPPSDT